MRKFALLVVALFSLPALSQTGHDEGHARHHDVYATWKIPGTANSCCRAKYGPNGEVLSGDCYPTVAEIRPSIIPQLKGAPVWWARRDTGEWVEIPDSAIIHERNPDPTGEGAHLCFNYYRVLCFRPPDLGG